MSNEPPLSSRRGIAFATSAGAAFGTLSIFAKLAYDAGATALPLLAFRFAFATVLLTLFHLITSRPILVGRRNAIRLLLLGGLGYGFEAALFFLALETAPAGVVGLIFYSYPLWTNVLGLATGLERFRGRVLIALALGTTGVASIFTVSGTDLAGPILALGAALAVAVYLLLAQVVMRGIPAPASALWTGAGAALTVGTVAAVTGWDLPAGALVPAGALGLASAVAFALLYAAIARIGSARSAIANMVEPVTTLLLAAIILGEDLTLRIAVGAVLVVSALPVLARAQAHDDRMNEGRVTPESTPLP
jgi:drug/metabolite transporter (DMT)-like permease